MVQERVGDCSPGSDSYEHCGGRLQLAGAASTHYPIEMERQTLVPSWGLTPPARGEDPVCQQEVCPLNANGEPADRTLKSGSFGFILQSTSKLPSLKTSFNHTGHLIHKGMKN